MGIETLIIFIAMIIVAAIAAGVLLRTQGVLQQRALAVGAETRERLVTGVEILSVVGFVNTTASTINQFEITLRPRSGSSEVQLLTLGVTLTTKDYFLPMILMNTAQSSAHAENIVALDAAQKTLTYNLNYDPNDYATTQIHLVNNSDSPDNLSGLNITIISSLGAVTKSFVFPLGINFSNTTAYINMTQVPIYENTSDIFSPSYGFLTLRGYSSGANSINTSQNFTTFTIQSDIDNVCDWENLVADFRFCSRVRLGNQNTLLELGEIMSLRMKMSNIKAVSIDQTVNFVFIPKGGSIEEIIVYIPQVLTRQVQTLWP